MIGVPDEYLYTPSPILGRCVNSKRTLSSMRPLAVLGDNITYDHLSPSNAILASGEMESTFQLWGPQNHFNSYATHRGIYLTAQRATFANPKLFNEMVRENGEEWCGSLTRVEPEGEISRMWEAIETYVESQATLIIIAGADYGQGFEGLGCERSSLSWC